MPEQEKDELVSKSNALEEGLKLLYDLFKHITTLSTGSILILLAFLKDLFKDPEWKFLVACSFIAFILSVVSSIITMLAIVTYVRDAGSVSDDAEKVFKGSFIFTVITFTLGISSLVAFALKNFY